MKNDGKTPSEFAREERSADLTPMLRILLDGRTLSVEETTSAFESMMTGDVHHGEMGAFLALLATRLPTPEELEGAATVMRRHVTGVQSNVPSDRILDTAGTGGAPKTFNVSTAAALVAAGSGAIVAKHGNRSRTGRGSAEALQSMGINVDADTSVQARCLEEAGICFCFAIHHHPATRHVMPVRKSMGVPTIFNLLGPLTNPAGAGRQLMGVWDGVYQRPVAEALGRLGTNRALVVHSDDGLDELSISAPSTVVELNDGTISTWRVTPEEAGLATADISSVTARDLDHATVMMRAVLDGSEQGPPRDMTLLNAAAALLASGVVSDIREGVQMAASSIDEGKATASLERLVAISNK
ncbi:MAG: anthranilate phosphoribosyltransferase [Phycisphaerales bacterium]|nr:anthranilate phosphoribosyltransferase [Phycisphaerales bacterium]